MARRSKFSVELVVETGDWNDIPADAIVADLAVSLGRRLPEAEGTAVVALADDASVHDLNRRFRNVDRPTNVLSFPSGEAAGRAAHLGDVVLAIETLRGEAAEQSKPLSDHFAHLALHGLLHLFGYDHQNDREATCMERLEAMILNDLSIPNPYLEASELSHT